MIGYSLPPSCLGNDHKQVLESMRCPLSLQIFKDPVILLGDCRTYERDLIAKWLQDHKTSPITRENITSPDLIENRSLKELVSEFLSLHPQIQYSDAQYLSPSSVVDFHNALLGYIPLDKTKNNQNKQSPAPSSQQDVLQYISSLLAAEPRLVLISFESQQEKVSAFQFACKHASDEAINMLFDRLRRVYKLDPSHCKGVFKGVLRGKFVGLVKQALKNPKMEDYDMMKTMGISANFMFLTAASALDTECIQRSIERGSPPLEHDLTMPQAPHTPGAFNDHRSRE
jgi:U-box domain